MERGVDYIGVATPFYCNDGKGHFLFQRRSKNCKDERGNWSPGSGALDFGCTPEENVLREVKEEYGCNGEIQERLPAHSVVLHKNGVRIHWISIPFFVKINPKEVKNMEPDKVDKIEWFSLGKFPKPLYSGFNFTFNHYKKFFDKYKV